VQKKRLTPVTSSSFSNLAFVLSNSFLPMPSSEELAPLELVAAYERQAVLLNKQIRTPEHQSRTLAALRDPLLSKLLSGRLGVSDFSLNRDITT
jgi:hypothetical protein